MASKKKRKPINPRFVWKPEDIEPGKKTIASAVARLIEKVKAL